MSSRMTTRSMIASPAKTVKTPKIKASTVTTPGPKIFHSYTITAPVDTPVSFTVNEFGIHPTTSTPANFRHSAPPVRRKPSIYSAIYTDDSCSGEEKDDNASSDDSAKIQRLEEKIYRLKLKKLLKRRARKSINSSSDDRQEKNKSSNSKVLDDFEPTMSGSPSRVPPISLDDSELDELVEEKPIPKAKRGRGRPRGSRGAASTRVGSRKSTRKSNFVHTYDGADSSSHQDDTSPNRTPITAKNPRGTGTKRGRGRPRKTTVTRASRIEVDLDASVDLGGKVDELAKSLTDCYPNLFSNDEAGNEIGQGTSLNVAGGSDKDPFDPSENLEPPSSPFPPSQEPIDIAIDEPIQSTAWDEALASVASDVESSLAVLHGLNITGEEPGVQRGVSQSTSSLACTQKGTVNEKLTEDIFITPESNTRRSVKATSSQDNGPASSPKRVETINENPKVVSSQSSEVGLVEKVAEAPSTDNGYCSSSNSPLQAETQASDVLVETQNLESFREIIEGPRKSPRVSQSHREAASQDSESDDDRALTPLGSECENSSCSDEEMRNPVDNRSSQSDDNDGSMLHTAQGRRMMNNSGGANPAVENGEETPVHQRITNGTDVAEKRREKNQSYVDRASDRKVVEVIEHVEKSPENEKLDMGSPAKKSERNVTKSSVERSRLESSDRSVSKDRSKKKNSPSLEESSSPVKEVPVSKPSARDSNKSGNEVTSRSSQVFKEASQANAAASHRNPEHSSVTESMCLDRSEESQDVLTLGRLNDQSDSATCDNIPESGSGEVNVDSQDQELTLQLGQRHRSDSPLEPSASVSQQTLVESLPDVVRIRAYSSGESDDDTLRMAQNRRSDKQSDKKSSGSDKAPEEISIPANEANLDEVTIRSDSDDESDDDNVLTLRTAQKRRSDKQSDKKSSGSDKAPEEISIPENEANLDVTIRSDSDDESDDDNVLTLRTAQKLRSEDQSDVRSSPNQESSSLLENMRKLINAEVYKNIALASKKPKTSDKIDLVEINSNVTDVEYQKKVASSDDEDFSASDDPNSDDEEGEVGEYRERIIQNLDLVSDAERHVISTDDDSEDGVVKQPAVAHGDKGRSNANACNDDSEEEVGKHAESVPRRIVDNSPEEVADLQAEVAPASERRRGFMSTDGDDFEEDEDKQPQTGPRRIGYISPDDSTDYSDSEESMIDQEPPNGNMFFAKNKKSKSKRNLWLQEETPNLDDEDEVKVEVFSLMDIEKEEVMEMNDTETKKKKRKGEDLESVTEETPEVVNEQMNGEADEMEVTTGSKKRKKKKNEESLVNSAEEREENQENEGEPVALDKKQKKSKIIKKTQEAEDGVLEESQEKTKKDKKGKKKKNRYEKTVAVEENGDLLENDAGDGLISEKKKKKKDKKKKKEKSMGNALEFGEEANDKREDTADVENEALTKKKKKRNKNKEKDSQIVTETEDDYQEEIAKLPEHFLKDLAAVKAKSSGRKGEKRKGNDETLKPKKVKNCVNPIESEDYIPLSTTSTTRFGVVPLDSSSQPPAASFKDKMLLSPDIKRISSQKQHALKMKSKAGKFKR